MSTPLAEFPEILIDAALPAWCVDGRRSLDMESSNARGAKMLGGSLHLVLLWCLWERHPFNSHAMRLVFDKLKAAGFGLGVHRGSHQEFSEHLSDCGFADNLVQILTIAIKEEHTIKKRLTGQQLTNTYKKIKNYSLTEVYLWGNMLVQVAETLGAQVHEVVGDHHEEEAFVNFSTKNTLDTTEENDEGHQAFDLDLGVVAEEAVVLGLPKDFVIAASLILYTATEIVLVEKKGKHSLPVISRV